MEDRVAHNTPAIVKLGSFAGKIKYCLVDTISLPLLSLFQLKIKYIEHRLIIVAKHGPGKLLDEIPLHNLIWQYFSTLAIPLHCSVRHRNGITMDNRLTNLCLTFDDSFWSPADSHLPTNFYWQTILLLPVDMDEVEFHGGVSPIVDNNEEEIPYECHNAPCTQLLRKSFDEQFICSTCKQIIYCSRQCLEMDADIHSVFCNPIGWKN